MALPARVHRALLESPLGDFQREFDSVVNRFFGRDAGTLFAPYGVDILEDADRIVVDAELPGFAKDEVDVTLENQTLTISAERREKPENGAEGQYLLNERRYTRFLRSFTLPPTVDESSVQARLADGILTVTVTKREETKPRKIAVS